MERKFMVYQRRDGFQIAEEATGTRLENGMEFLARPNKSGLWCTAAFNVVIDDDYELVGEEIIDCSNQPAQVLCFVDGVMKTIDQSRIATEDMIERAEDAISNRNIPAARAWKIDIDAAIEQYHAKALEMNESLDEAFSRIDEHAPDDDAKAIFKAIASKYEVGCVIGINAAHAKALEMDKKVNQALLALSSNPLSAGWHLHSPAMKAQAINIALSEALEMNAQFDRGITNVAEVS